jgi:hypothetical protein
VVTTTIARAERLQDVDGAAPSEPGYMSVRGLAAYSSLSIRTLRSYLVHPLRPLPHFRVGGKILVRRADFDAWLNGFKVQDSGDFEQLVNETLQGL